MQIQEKVNEIYQLDLRYKNLNLYFKGESTKLCVAMQCPVWYENSQS